MKMPNHTVGRVALLALLLSTQPGSANNDDRFNVRETEGRDFGPEDWGSVECDNVGECLGWPDGWELGVGWELETNQCRHCPVDGEDCGNHHQSPINLERDRAIPGHENEKICYDYHWMAYQDGSCEWHDMVKNGYSVHSNNFMIERHALQILQPVDEDGELQCDGHSGRRFPRLDYSKGFPDWWFLSHTDVTVPSQHTQEGKRYDAEVHLAHFYSVDHTREVGKVALFLEADPTRERWDFLDKLICQWRETEEKTRDECGLESVPPYPGCRNPDREAGETNLPAVDPYPFIDCDSVENSQRICKPTSCCEAERNQGDYCQDEVYGFYGDEVVGSICWWCCPGKLLGPGEPSEQPPDLPSSTAAPSTVEAPSFAPSVSPTIAQPQTPSLAPTMSAIPTTMAPVTRVPTAMAPATLAPVTTAGPIQTGLPAIQPSLPETLLPTTEPTELATPSAVKMTQPSPFQCSDYDDDSDINFNRICKEGGCCDPVRSASNHCHAIYKFFGDSMTQVCSECCEPSKALAPAPPPNPKYPPIDCTLVDRPERICKPTSCCEPTMSLTRFCLDTYRIYGDTIGSICWHCCSEPKEADPSLLPDLPLTPVAPDPTISPELPTSQSPGTALSLTVSSGFSYSSEGFQCSDYNDNPDINFNRICKDGGCCDSVRSASDHCHFVYKFFGVSMVDVCSGCCVPGKQLAPAPPPNPKYPPIDCTLVNRPERICKATSCCEPEKSDTQYCKDVYEEYGDSIGSVCWHCCSEPKRADPSFVAGPLTLAIGSPSFSPVASVTGRNEPVPTVSISLAPSESPSFGPTDATAQPSSTPSHVPSNIPTTSTPVPSNSVSSSMPSGLPSDMRSSAPSIVVTTNVPTSEGPSSVPSNAPSTETPSHMAIETTNPPSTATPSVSLPSDMPSAANTTGAPVRMSPSANGPSNEPSNTPSARVTTTAPTTGAPSSSAPSNVPSIAPSMKTPSTSFPSNMPTSGQDITSVPITVAPSTSPPSTVPTKGEGIGIVSDTHAPSTLFPSSLPTIQKVPITTIPTTSPSPNSTTTSFPTTSPTVGVANTNAAAEPFDCNMYRGYEEANFDRICRDGGCCDPQRSEERFCHRAYNLFGDNMSAACSGCCDPPKQLAPAPPPHPVYQPIDCTIFSNTKRICKAGSCCDPVMSTSRYCEGFYLNQTDEIASACWYCCSEPREIDIAIFDLTPRPTRSPTTAAPVASPTVTPSAIPSMLPTSESNATFAAHSFGSADESTLPPVNPSPTSEPTVNPTFSIFPTPVSSEDPTQDPEPVRHLRATTKADKTSSPDDKERAGRDILLPSGVWVGDLIMDPENFEVTENLEEEYLVSIKDYDERQKQSKERRRNLEEEAVQGDNYINTPYSPYEWMREVRTEYYYRYEGSLVSPPCFETVHWRVMKDPIRIHPDQLKELERLLAWRIAPMGSQFNECQHDTAGRERPGSDGDAVDLNRPLQQYSTIHRKTFCECKDWESKFIEDREWCDSGDYEYRLYEHPYNFESDGFEP